MKISDKIVKRHGLKLEEFNQIRELMKREPNMLELGIFSAMWNEHCSYKSSKICDLLQRTPNITELGIFSAMWNEHCSYKSSRFHLKNLPTKGNAVIQGPGENAGVIDIGDDDAIVFKNKDSFKKRTKLVGIGNFFSNVE